MVRKSSTDKTDEELVEPPVAGDTVMVLGSKQENGFEAYGVRVGERELYESTAQNEGATTTATIRIQAK